MQQPAAIERAKTIKVVTLSTDGGSAYNNWLHGARRLGYDVTVLGLGQKWGGWPWRTQQYIAAVRALPPTALVLVVDMGDVLFVRGPASLYRAYKAIGSPLVFGGEPTCCVGKFDAKRLNGERGRAMSTIDARLPRNRWKFPNAGCIMGPRDVVLAALEGVKNAPDDQAGHLERYLADERYLTIDWQHAIVGGVNKPGLFYCVDQSIASDPNAVELEYWERVTREQLVAEAERDGSDPTRFADSVGRTLYRNKQTGGVPCLLHFAGKNVRGYNLFGAALYGSAFRPLEEERTASVGAAALVSIAHLWKS
jgi:hypothetical protein